MTSSVAKPKYRKPSVLAAPGRNSLDERPLSEEEQDDNWQREYDGCGHKLSRLTAVGERVFRGIVDIKQRSHEVVLRF